MRPTECATTDIDLLGYSFSECTLDREMIPQRLSKLTSLSDPRRQNRGSLELRSHGHRFPLSRVCGDHSECAALLGRVHRAKLLFICKGFEIYANYEGTAWSVAPSRRELQVIGCLPTVQDQDNWPACAGLVVGETGECYSCPRRSKVDGLYPARTAIVGLTLLRRYLDRNCELPA